MPRIARFTPLYNRRGLQRQTRGEAPFFTCEREKLKRKIESLKHGLRHATARLKELPPENDGRVSGSQAAYEAHSI
jgi:hypothetical protein